MVALLRRCFRRPSGVPLAVVLVLGGLLTAIDAAPTRAQGYGWFGGLFGGEQPQSPYAEPRYPQSGDRPRPYATRRRVQRFKQPVEQTQEQDTASKARAPQKTATVFVYVFGDSLGQLLANGLDDALADKAEVGIVHMGRGSSGLVNDAYYDWPKTINDLLALQGKPSPNKPDSSKPGVGTRGPVQDKPVQGRIDVAVMMIGSNDRQPFVQDGRKIEAGSDAWNAIYRKRVMAIAEAFQKQRIPLIWVGVPIVKSDDFADDMAALNEIYRDAAARTGAVYVDTWEPFSDANGDFAAYGPDINGQNVRLRTAEGIYFTKAGARKLAHFVEAPVRRDLDGKTPLPELPTADVPPVDSKGTKPGQESKGAKPTVALVKPEAGPIKNLGEPPAAKEGRLTDVTRFKAEASQDSIVANALVKGQTDPAPAGRADNFRWPPSDRTGVPPR